MTKEEKNEIIKKCERCKTTFRVLADGLDPDVENTEEMKKYAGNYCPVCRLLTE